jgi:hypothetical protein
MGQGQQGAVDVAGAQVVADEDLLFRVFGGGEKEMAAAAGSSFPKTETNRT